MAVVNSHPIQYFAPLYAFLNESPQLELTAIYCSDFSLRGAIDPGFGKAVSWDLDLLSGYPSIFLGDKAATRTPSGFWSLICPEILAKIRRGRYDAIVIHGYGYAVNLLALFTAKLRRTPVLMRSETHLGLSRTGWKRRIRDRLLSVAYRFVDGFLAIGTANHAYYRALGVPERKIFDVPYAVDNHRFASGAALTPERRAAIRQNYGLPLEGVVVLYASKLMRRKHPDDVIHALARLRDKNISTTCFIVGTGEMERELRELVGSLGLDNVIFGGFVNQSELPGIYGASDVFVLPSENEPWGLVVNEVMSAGLPVIVANEVGCVADLVRDGLNGYHTRAGDVQSLATALEKLLLDEEQRTRMGAAGRRIIADWGFEQCRSGIIRALTSVSRRR